MLPSFLIQALFESKLQIMLRFKGKIVMSLLNTTKSKRRKAEMLLILKKPN